MPSGFIPEHWPTPATYAPDVARRQYRLALYDEEGQVIEGAQFMYASDETPTPGLRVDLPRGTWFVHEVVATWNEDTSSRLVGTDPHDGGTLICHPAPQS
jgi:hypothetical protein